jgi:4a-hydroxytetrahydrobiopterin dehydratase
MTSLAEKTCTPCRGGIPPLTRDEAESLHAQAPDWQLLDDAHRIERTFRLANFREALTFVQQVGELAETEGHHPDISFGWGYVTVSLRTKKIKGLHENDFIMAAKIDRMLILRRARVMRRYGWTRPPSAWKLAKPRALELSEGARSRPRIASETDTRRLYRTGRTYFTRLILIPAGAKVN